jgi:WD40 repeat protein
MRVASAGGVPVAVTALDSARHEMGHRFPRFLPDGRHFLFATYPDPADGRSICIGALGSRKVKTILSARSTPAYAEPGYLLFERDRQIMAQRFDANRLQLRGEPVGISEAPEFSAMLGDPAVSASRNGIVAMLRSQPPNTRLMLLDRTGSTRARYGLQSAPWEVVAVARNGKRAALGNGGDLWILDLRRMVPLPFSAGRGSRTAAWSPDGDRLAFISSDHGREEVTIGTLEGQSQVIRTSEDPFKYVSDWSRDGRYIVFITQGAPTGMDIWLLPLDGDRKPVPYLRTPARERTACVSPDGRWLAYVSDESGQNEIYVQSFPQPGGKVRISLDGGDGPIWWARAGRELLYVHGPTVMSVPVATGVDFLPGTPRPLFTHPPGVTSGDVMDDGESFLVSVAAGSRPRDIQIIANWRALLKR